ncbi:hypothetical protein GGH19_002001 [Coemansia sp. RSA 1807]|nr:hypothetical protein EV181_002549 [Coemansia sp. RSA 532]KAJ2270104.1 hypothetical protein J3F81_004024 [Coemansia sp. RSA 371]KAJ2423237.1 hypothetical protein IWW41_005030 [Coemansia sp. RSA 2522]KAJ2576633.1 hypothetical protein GGH19_002001 [Coemansia sp. RSA 1807]
MRKILRQRTHEGGRGSVAGTSGVSTANASTANNVSAALSGVRRSGSTPNETSRRSSTSRPTTDILSHLQELKAQERQVLSRGARDTQPATPIATGSASVGSGSRHVTSAEELRSKQERQAREERLASQYRDQLHTRMQGINDTAIDLGYQKSVMAQFERQMLGSSSPREQEQLELERVNGVRALIGLPPLPPLPALGSVRQSRPGTPMYAASSPAHIPSPSPYSSHPPPPPPFALKSARGSYLQQHRRTTSFGDNAPDRDAHRHRRTDSTASQQRKSNARDGGISEDDEEQDMEIDHEDGEISEEGELVE